MRVAVALLLGFTVVPVDPSRAAEKADEAAAIAKIKALEGEIERRPTIAGRLGSLPGASPQPDNAEGPVFAVELNGSEQLKDEDLRCLRSFPGLRQLSLDRTSASDAGLKQLAGLKHLTRLELMETTVTDAGLRELTGLQELRVLYLGNTEITDAGLPAIGKLKNLRSLLLGGTAISDAGLKELKNLHNLAFLDLSQTKITDAGLRELGGLQNLKKLFVGQTRVTEAGVQRLKESLPGARILRRTPGQNADPDFDVSIPHPSYTEKHPTILFDEAHKNLHTAGGSYKVFADLVTNDGCRVTPNRQPFTADLLAKYDLLVIVNAPARRGTSKSAFTKAECDCVETWVRGGGSLLLITDHHPFGAGSQELGARFGVQMGLSVAVDPANKIKEAILFSRHKNQLGEHAIMRGRDKSERVDRVLTFTGQSLKGPPGSVPLLKFADTAMDISRDDKRTSDAGRSQGVALKFGRGRVVVMGEAAELSAQIVGDPPEKSGMNVPGCDNRKLALNIVHWLTGLID